jgi:hypothetical protein
MDKLRYADALAAYTESYTLSPQPAVLYNMGRALEALDRLPEALEKLKAFRAAATPELLARVPGLDARIVSLEKRVSTLTIKTNVNGARVLVRDKVVGSTPFDAPLVLPAGKADIAIEAEGYFPYRKQVDLPGGGALALDADLSSKATRGLLVVKTEVLGAEVLVDGKRIGVAPVEASVAPGTHTIAVRHRDHRDYDTSVVMKAGETRDVLAKLEPPSIATRWYFWTGIGAAVLAGAAVTVVVLSERAPDRGDIAPGQLTAPNAMISPYAPVFRF